MLNQPKEGEEESALRKTIPIASLDLKGRGQLTA